MSELKASPGPYTAGYDEREEQHYVADAAGNVVVAGLDKADAHLLAASWEMYKELETYRKKLSATHRTVKHAGLIESGRDTIGKRLKRLDALLAKARGETP